MKIEVWVKETIEINDDVLFDLIQEEREFFIEDDAAEIYLESIIYRAVNKVYITDLLERDWMVHEDFDGPYSHDELRSVIEDQLRQG